MSIFDDAMHVCVNKKKLSKQDIKNIAILDAAPELLFALKNITERYCALVNSRRDGDWNPENESTVAEARAAIAKAKVEV